MKFQITLAGVMFFALCSAATILHAASGDIRNTKHNMSSTGPTNGLVRQYQSALESQICVFCHTPHNATPSAPLWNKVMPDTTVWKFYSSGTRSSAVKGASLPAGSVSLLCLSCHDGKTAVNIVHNASGTTNMASNGIDKVIDIMFDVTPTGFPMSTYGGFGGYAANIGAAPGPGNEAAGNYLVDDHPIGFSYESARLASGGKLKTITEPKIRLFTVGADANRLECSSCHDPHVAAPAKFLVMNNAGSALCLSCHDK